MPSNFDFLHDQFPDLHEAATHTESLIYTAPRASCFYARYTLERAVHWLYDNDPYLVLPYDKKLGALVHEPTFKDNLKPGLFPKIRTILKTGNIAAHEATALDTRDALRVTEELFHVLYWLHRFYAPDGRNLPPLHFERDRIPQATDTTTSDLTREQLQELEARLAQTDEMRRIAEEREQRSQAELTRLKAEIAALKQQNATTPDTHNYNEADTRRYLIDLLLREAGWTQIRQPGWSEVEVSGMPNDSGIGYADYVLWGNDGKPLAVVEAKRTTRDASTGKQQAKLYADCLQAQYDQRPVIFYSNGYETWIWDDLAYPPRLIQGFLKQDELERLIFRRSHRKRLHLVQPSEEIAGRSYQLEALRRLTETFDREKARKTLLVMATGTGKTRTAIALVDLLKRANWVKRVLFLADRTTLVRQAKRAFTRYLPKVTAVNLIENKAVETADVVLSTYPTAFNYINQTNGEQRLFGPGHFDLVIVDEAHRSIYRKYSALFDYFDALLLGLTATPRDEVHRDTYRTFELEPGVPTFAYELPDAIADGYLVPPRGVDVPFKFLRRGIRYADLSPEEQADYEERFRDDDTGEIPDEIDANALNRWLFNINTVDRALELLLERGLKVDGGDRLGKTIIFARSHEHAKFIVERFDANYPHYRGQFAQVIDSHNAYAQSLLDDFAEPNKLPQIAVSVDMLDTGVDVPEVVNLVFFKPVYSRVKFNQMIGRGTRLCPDLFAPGEQKEEFLVFDLCGNFEFFEQEITIADPRPADSLTARLVKARLALTCQLDGKRSEQAELRSRHLDQLHQHVASMERDNFLVRRHLRQVETFSERDRWNRLGEEDVEAIATTLAHLPNSLPRENPLTKRFDLLCLQLQLAILKGSDDFIRLRDRARDLAGQLETKRNIPMVAQQLPLIEEIQAESWWTDVTPSMVEEVRIRLRDLVTFIDREQQAVVYTNFADDLGEISQVNVPIQQTGFSPYQYRKKVEAYIRANENHVAIAKLKRNLPLTESDLSALEEMLFSAEAIESRDRFESVYGSDLSLKLFIRQLVGLDRAAAKQAFATYLENKNFSANQIRFVENIIDYLTQNGVMDPGLLYEPPFTEFHYEGLDGVFEAEDADRLIAIVRSFNETVGVKFGAA